MKLDDVFVLESAGWPALLVNSTGTILRANQAAVKVFGGTLEGASPLLSAIWPAENGVTAEQFLAQRERSLTATSPLKFRVKGGGTALFLVSICTFSKDDQRCFVFQMFPESAVQAAGKGAPAETGLLQKQKLDCALQLARTVSLDFNNALTSILGHTSLLLSQAEAGHPWRHSLLEVEKSAGKAAEIANDLAAFSRQDREPRGPASGNLNSVLRRSAAVVQDPKAQKLNWNLQLGQRLFAAKFDETKIGQAFGKIIENAVEAVSDRGQISIQTRNVELSDATQDQDLHIAPGNYVCAEIRDDGNGIAADILPRVFEPFFTTKKSTGHRGLGLALVYGIVTNHGGGVAISSHAGAGTSVRVYLPAERRIARDNTARSGDLNGSQTVLMVDDEDLLLTMGQTVLSAYGYRVLTAHNGQKALDILSRGDAAIDLVITDLVMPGMSGRELIEHIRHVSPQTRVLCTSGYARPSGQFDSFVYLQKPFTSQELLIRVKDALAASAEH